MIERMPITQGILVGSLAALLVFAVLFISLILILPSSDPREQKLMRCALGVSLAIGFVFGVGNFAVPFALITAIASYLIAGFIGIMATLSKDEKFTRIVRTAVPIVVAIIAGVIVLEYEAASAKTAIETESGVPSIGMPVDGVPAVEEDLSGGRG